MARVRIEAGCILIIMPKERYRFSTNPINLFYQKVELYIKKYFPDLETEIMMQKFLKKIDKMSEYNEGRNIILTWIEEAKAASTNYTANSLVEEVWRRKHLSIKTYLNQCAYDSFVSNAIKSSFLRNCFDIKSKADYQKLVEDDQNHKKIGACRYSFFKVDILRPQKNGVGNREEEELENDDEGDDDDTLEEEAEKLSRDTKHWLFSCNIPAPPPSPYAYKTPFDSQEKDFFESLNEETIFSDVFKGSKTIYSHQDHRYNINYNGNACFDARLAIILYILEHFSEKVLLVKDIVRCIRANKSFLDYFTRDAFTMECIEDIGDVEDNRQGSGNDEKDLVDAMREYYRKVSEALNIEESVSEMLENKDFTDQFLCRDGYQPLFDILLTLYPLQPLPHVKETGILYKRLCFNKQPKDTSDAIHKCILEKTNKKRKNGLPSPEESRCLIDECLLSGRRLIDFSSSEISKRKPREIEAMIVRQNYHEYVLQNNGKNVVIDGYIKNLAYLIDKASFFRKQRWNKNGHNNRVLNYYFKDLQKDILDLIKESIEEVGRLDNGETKTTVLNRIKSLEQKAPQINSVINATYEKNQSDKEDPSPIPYDDLDDREREIFHRYRAHINDFMVKMGDDIAIIRQYLGKAGGIAKIEDIVIDIQKRLNAITYHKTLYNRYCRQAFVQAREAPK